MQKKIKSFDGTIINYDISRGENKKTFLIFVHGVAGNLKVWKRIRLFFRKRGISTLAVDLRGHGKSGKPKSAENYKLEDFAKDINEVIKKENIFSPIIVGHSLGTMVTLTFHRLYPKISEKYVLISGAYKIPRKLKSVFKNVLSFAHPFDKEIEKTKSYLPTYNFIKNLKEYNVINFINQMMSNSVKSILFVFENMNKFNEKKNLHNIRKPVLILGGRSDSVISIKNSEKMHKLIKNSKLRIFPTEDHEIINSIPKEISKEILSFINKK